MNAIDNRYAIEQYFAVLKECLEKHVLMEKPSQLYNFDEDGVPLDHTPQTTARYCQKRCITIHLVTRIKSLLLHVLMLLEVPCHRMLYLMLKT